MLFRFSRPVSSNMNQYRAFMGQLEDVAHSLNQATAHVQTIMNEVHETTNNALNPLHSLPSDVLAAIFALANEDRGRNFATRISQVNKGFRRAALQSPDLWSHVQPEWTSYKIRLYVERSTTVGLTIYIRNCDRLEKFMQIVSGEADRWHKVIFEFPEEKKIANHNGIDIPWNRFCSRIPKDLNLPNLTEIDFQGVPFLVNNEQLPFASWNMPNLRKFCGRSLLLPPSARNLKECSLLLKGSNATLIDGTQLCLGLSDLQACESLHISFGPFHNCTNFLSDDPDIAPSQLVNLRHFSAKIWHPSQYKA